MPNSPTGQPVSNRLTHIDSLRGFALLGILIVNFEYFNRPLQAVIMGAEPGLAGMDLVIDRLIAVLAEGKFYPLFSMLFGAGFALMAERFLDRGTPFWGIYLRRIFFLGLFGLAHALLVWAGDILLIYSLLAFVMVLLFRKTPLKRLWKWALFFIFLPALVYGALALMLWPTQFDEALHAEINAEFEQSAAEIRAAIERAENVHASGSYRDNIGQRINDLRFTLTNALFWVPPMLGFFLLGRWLIGSQRLTHPSEHKLFFRRWRSRGLVVGLVFAVIATVMLERLDLIFPTPALTLAMILALAAGALLSMAYLSILILAAERVRFLAPAGQMALTNYLAQSLFWTWMIYGHGLGLWGQLPRWSHLFLALAFFAVQVVISRWWIQRFRFGPAEWLWRTLTYWQLQPMRN
jgi:uncharacterized protein